MSEATFTNFSAALVSFKAPNGHQLNLKFDNLDNYASPQNPYFGASVGRVANRIFGSKIEVAGETYKLPSNDGASTTLHGGPKGWAKKNWDGPFEEERDGRKATVFKLTSEHLDEGFPGKVNAKVYYTPYSVTNDEGVEEFFLEVEYEAQLADDSPVDETVIHLTNHSHLSVSPNPDSFEGTRVKLFSNQWLEKDKDGVINGNLVPFSATPADLSFFTMDKTGPCIDDAFALRDLEKCDGPDTRHVKPQPCIHYYHPDNKVNLQVFTTEPVAQFYTCKFTNVPKLEGESRAFPPNCAIATEPGRPINAACIDKWRPWVTLKKGETYGSKIVYCTWIGETKDY